MTSLKTRASCLRPDPALVYGARFHWWGDHHFEVRFRSELAVSWALFFHALGLDWEYEPEEFDVPGAGGIRHVPDFRVTSPQGLVAWYHVRPRGAVLDPVGDLFSRWVTQGNGESRVAVRQLNGDPMDVLVQPYGLQQSPWDVCPRCGGIGVSRPRHSGRLDMINCDACGHTLPADDGALPEPGIYGMQVHPYKGGIMVDVGNWVEFRQRVTVAAMKAAQARRPELDSPLKRVPLFTEREFKALLNAGVDIEARLRNAGLEVPEALRKAKGKSNSGNSTRRSRSGA